MIIIAQQQPDGVIRYVSVPKFYNYDLPHILRNFYPKESRVSALIDLGNLVTLRPTPFGKPRDYYDKVYCRARIRDDKEKKGRHQPRYADSEEDLLKLETEGFLFKEGQWHHSRQGHSPRPCRNPWTMTKTMACPVWRQSACPQTDNCTQSPKVKFQTGACSFPKQKKTMSRISYSATSGLSQPSIIR